MAVIPSVGASAARAAPCSLRRRRIAALFNCSRLSRLLNLSLCSFTLSILGDDSEQLAFRKRSHFLFEAEQLVGLVQGYLQGVDQVGQCHHPPLLEQGLEREFDAE